MIRVHRLPSSDRVVECVLLVVTHRADQIGTVVQKDLLFVARCDDACEYTSRCALRIIESSSRSSKMVLRVCVCSARVSCASERAHGTNAKADTLALVERCLLDCCYSCTIFVDRVDEEEWNGM